jgi:DNA gyrase subunit A
MPEPPDTEVNQTALPLGNGNGPRVLPVNVEDEMKSSYLDYAMSVIVSRALPDVRDGLKPVHRRILYGMQELGLGAGRAFKKSARIVGDVMGKYHPHGDMAIYDALVRMVQDFSMRYPLVDGQGNFGSIDGDSAAAMRYTEARLARLAEEILTDFDKETVDFVPNYDETLQVPAVLPSKLPNLLVNGADGIAVGMATRIPPHNLREVVAGACAMIDNPAITSEQLMEYVVAPDFPTGGIIFGRDGVRDAYTTGRGRVIVRAKANIEEAHKGGRDRIVVTEIPYQVNKSRLIENIVQLIEHKKVEGIADIRDESDRDGMRLVIELKKEAIPDIVLSQLFKHSPLQGTFGVILLALVGGIPKILTLRELFEHFLAHRHEVVVRRTQFELRQARERMHILEGLQTALDHIDEVIELIRQASSPEVAQGELMAAFELSEKQAKAILDMRLQRLTGLERQKLHDEMVELRAKIEELERLMASRDERMKLVKDELVELAEKYGDARRTEIIEETAEVNLEDLIAPEEMVVTVSHAGYIKRFPVSGFRRQGRGGRGLQGARPKEEDFIQHLFVASTHDYILFFTDKGKCYWLKVHEVPQLGRGSRGTALVNLIEPLAEEKVCHFVTVPDFAEGRYVMMVTRKGTVKKTSLAEFSNPRKTGIIAIKIEPDDELIEAVLTEGDSEVVIGTSQGKAVRFHESDVRPMGRAAQGVRGVSLPEGAWVVGMIVAREEGCVLTVTERGYGKRSPINEYRLTKRGAQGVLALKTTPKTGPMVAIMNVADEDDLMIITSHGVVIRQGVHSIREIGRVTQGVRLIRLDEGDHIADIAKVVVNGEEEA